jgi:hypothetical protein
LLALLPPEVQFLANFGNTHSNVPSSWWSAVFWKATQSLYESRWFWVFLLCTLVLGPQSLVFFFQGNASSSFAWLVLVHLGYSSKVGDEHTFTYVVWCNVQPIQSPIACCCCRVVVFNLSCGDFSAVT